MAEMILGEPQSAADYDDRTTTAVKTVLIEIGQILGSFKGKFAIVGGAVPWLLLGNEDMPHVGTLDVDLGLDAEALGDGEYATLIEALRGHGYQQRRELRPVRSHPQTRPTLNLLPGLCPGIPAQRGRPFRGERRDVPGPCATPCRRSRRRAHVSRAGELIDYFWMRRRRTALNAARPSPSNAIDAGSGTSEVASPIVKFSCAGASTK